MHTMILGIARRIRFMLASCLNANFADFITSKYIKVLVRNSQFLPILTVNHLGGERFGCR